MSRAYCKLAALLIGVCLAQGEMTMQTGGPNDKAPADAAGGASSAVAQAPGPMVSCPAGCAPQQTSLLFTLRANAASITPVDAKFGNVTLLLKDVGNVTTFFSNLPEHFAGRITTSTFVNSWATNKTDWAPNAAMIATNPTIGKDRSLILTLDGPPKYDMAARTLTFNATYIDKNVTVPGDKPGPSVVNNIVASTVQDLLVLQAKGGKLPTYDFTEVQLFIDNWGGCWGWNGIFIHSGWCAGGGWGWGWGR